MKAMHVPDLQHLAGVRRLFFADGDAMLRSMAGTILMALGWKVYHALNVEDAGSLFASCKDCPDQVAVVLMLDPNQGGCIPRTALRSLDQFDPPVRLMVGNGLLQDEGPALGDDPGLDEVLPEVFAMRGLSETLRRMERDRRALQNNLYGG